MLLWPPKIKSDLLKNAERASTTYAAVEICFCCRKCWVCSLLHHAEARAPRLSQTRSTTWAAETNPKGPCSDIGYRRIMENQMDKGMKYEMESGIMLWLIGPKGSMQVQKIHSRPEKVPMCPLRGPNMYNIVARIL